MRMHRGILFEKVRKCYRCKDGVHSYLKAIFGEMKEYKSYLLCSVKCTSHNVIMSTGHQGYSDGWQRQVSE